MRYLSILTIMIVLTSNLLGQLNGQPEILSVSFGSVSDSNIVTIVYDVYEPDGDLLNIRALVSDDRGQTFNVPVTSLTGDVGSGIQWGIGKEIYWKIDDDLPEGWSSQQVVIKIVADDGKGYSSYDTEWVEIPAGQIPRIKLGKRSIDYNFSAMKYEVSIRQYVKYLNDAFSENKVWIGYSPQNPDYPYSFNGYYPGDGDLLTEGDKVFGSLVRNGSNNFPNITFEEGKFHWYNNFEGRNGELNDPDYPVQVTFFGAWAFAEYNNLSLPNSNEWYKLCFGDSENNYPWGDTIDSSMVNIKWFDFYETPWMKYYKYLNGVTPIGFFNGQSIDGIMGYYFDGQTKMGFQTTDTPNSYGIYDVIGNVGEWTTNKFQDFSDDRVVWGLSFDSYPPYADILREGSLDPSNMGTGFRCISRAGSEGVSKYGFLFVRVLTEIDDKFVAHKFELHQNYPNPFNPSTIVKYGLPEQSNVKIEIFNMLGQSVGVLVNQGKSAGFYETTWNAENLPSGIYLISIRAEGLNTKKNFTQVKKALLLK